MEAYDGQNIAPTELRTPLAQVKVRLVELIENHACDIAFDPHTNEAVDFLNPTAGPCFVFLSHSLSVALDFYTSPRPNHMVCDIFLALPELSVIVLSLVNGDEDSLEAVAYNVSVARGAVESLSMFMDEDINSIHGVMHMSLLEYAVGFKNRLKKLANDSAHFVTKDSLVMTPGRYEKVLTAFWAGVAETKSVLKEESGDTNGDFLRFLTKEQCIILVENINGKDVEVKCVPGSGATTLMLEVARRLNRLGNTLLVCRSLQERDRLRLVYSSAVAAEDLGMVDMSSCVNIVDETNTFMAQTSGQKWRFTTYPTNVKELKSQILEADMEIKGMEKQIGALSNDSWKERTEYILEDFSVLKMFSLKLELPLSVRELRHNPDYKSSDRTASKVLGGCKHLTATQEARLLDFHERLSQRKNLVSLLRSVIIQDKTHTIYQDVKQALLTKALRSKERTESKQRATMVGDVESPGIHHLMETFHIEPVNVGKKSDIPPVLKEGGKKDGMELEVQNTDPEDLENHWGEIEKLNQDLNSLLKDRDHRKGQLYKSYTVEWQAVLEYMARHTVVLQLLNIEIPGLEVFQNKLDRHESTTTGRVSAMLQQSAVSASGHDDTGEQTGPLTKKEQRFDISCSTASQSENTKNRAEERRTRTEVLINQLRQYQHGRLKEKHLCAITMKIIRDDEQHLIELKANNDRLEKDYGSSVHIVGLTRRPLLVSCPELHLDAARGNIWCHVTTDGQLVNSRPDTRDGGQNRLQTYRGTCSSPIPLPPSSSTLTPLPTHPRYWETETRVRVADGAWFSPALEMGLCEAGQVDCEVYVPLQRRSWCVRVGRCETHGRNLCTWVCREGERGECQQNSMPGTQGTQATLHYGIVLDEGGGRVAFIDNDREVVLVQYDEEFSEPLVPLYSAGPQYSGLTASMSLISGEDIDMTDTKKALIFQAMK
ncbi:uncharacterized protein [Haliotis asinina]|uniref:uncharacterized protein n=1 Tax=Haliotis asinina TaxID=109174 RepID=UPI0035318531